MNYITGVKEERERYVVKMDHFLKLGQIGTKLPPPPPRIESSCWGRNSIGEEGKGRLKKGRKGREWKDIKLVATLYTTVCIGR